MAAAVIQSSSKAGGHGTERFRTQSEGSNVKHCPIERQRTLSDQQSDRITSIRDRSSGLTNITDDKCSIDSGSRSSIQESDVLGDRKASAGSNSEFTFDTQDESKYKGMVKVHYFSASTRSNCRHCNKKFSVKLRPHHCRRCGDIYCMSCLRYRRKLNKLANLDPNGKPRKVCKTCFTEEGGTIGRTRNWKDEFFEERQLCKDERVLRQRKFSLTDTFRRDQLDMEKECSRLLHGFSEAVGTSEAKKTLHELHQLVKPPHWQKSSFWKVEKSAAHCRACKGSLGLRKKKRNCKVCGLALCKKCSNKELLLYIEDGNAEDRRRQPKLGVIKFVGCPEKEPDISLLLHVCKDCKEYIRDQQTTAPPPSNSLVTLISMNGEFTELQDRISPLISECEQILESLELSKKQDNASNDRLSGLLDRINKDLDTYEKLFHRLRHLGKKAETGTQTTLFKHYAMAKYDFYMENRHTYRRLRKITEPEQNNSISNFTKPNGMTEISKITKSTETTDQRLKEMEKDLVSDKAMDAVAESSTNFNTVQTDTEERKTEKVKRNSSFFDRNLRPGSFRKGKSKKKQINLDSEHSILIEVDENKTDTGGNPSSEEQFKHTVSFAKEIIKNSNVQQGSFKSFIDKDALIDKDTASKHTLEKAKPPEARTSSSRYSGELDVTKAIVADLEKLPDDNEENNTISVKRNNSFFDRKLRPGSFLKRKADKKPVKSDSETKVTEDENAENAEAVGIQYSKEQTDQAKISTIDTIGEQRSDQISFKTCVAKESSAENRKAKDETFEKAKSAKNTGKGSDKSSKTVQSTETTTELEEKSNTHEEISTGFDRKARKGSFFKRKTKKTELKSDPVRKLEEDEAETVIFENKSTVFTQITKDQSSDKSSLKDFTKPLEGTGKTLIRPIEEPLEEESNTDLETIQAKTKDNPSQSVKRNNSFFDRKLRPGSFLKRKADKKPFKSDSEPKVIEDENAENTKEVGVQYSKGQTEQAKISTIAIVGEQRPDHISFKTCVAKESFAENRKAKDETFDKVESAKNTGKGSDKSSKTVQSTETTTELEEKSNTHEEISTDFDRKARKGSFLKRKTKKTELKSDPVRKLEEDEAEAVIVENKSTISTQITKDQSSDKSSLKDFTKPLEGTGKTLIKPIEEPLEEESNTDLETIQAKTKDNPSQSVKRNNSFFDRQLRPGSFLKRKSKQKTFKSASETMEICEENTEIIKSTETVESLGSSDNADISADGKTSRTSGEISLTKVNASWKR